jgi:hypothetical protein
MVYNQEKKKGVFIFSSFLSPWRAKEWCLRVKKEYCEREEHIHTRN